MAANLAIAAGKIVIGSLANSLAVVADGLHSGVDALANAVALLILRYSTRPADEDHPYGHSKYETMAAFTLSVMVVTVAVNVAVAWSERRAGRRYASDVLLADAAQTRADVFVSLAVLAGLALHRLEIPGLDPILDPLLA